MVFLSTVMSPTNLLTIARNAFTSRNLDRRSFCLVIKTGTFLRCVVWPLVPPLLLYQYIRAKDEDMYSVELLKHRSHGEDGKAYYDPSMPVGAEHWRMQSDLRVIRNALRAE